MIQLRLSFLHQASLLIFIWLLFISSIPGTEFVFDDEHFILKNLYHQSWQNLGKYFSENMVAGAGMVSNLYRPLELLSHKVDLSLWGTWAPGHKITNIVIFSAAMIAFYRLLVQLLAGTRHLASLSSKVLEPARWGAFLGVLTFAAHPLLPADVSYLSGRSEMLMLLFGCLTLLHWQKAWFPAFFLLALASKENALAWPLMALGYDYITNDRRLAWKRHFVLWGMCSVYLILRVTVLNFQDFLNFYNGTNILTENFSYRVYTWFSSLAKGTELLLWPSGIHHQRSWPVFTEFLNPYVISGFVILASSLLVAYKARQRAPVITLGMLWFIGATIPTSNLIILINAVFYDHWFIMPGVGLLLVWSRFWQGVAATRWFAARPRRCLLAFALIILPLVLQSLQQSEVWRTRKGLFTYILQFEPNSTTVLNNLAMEYSDEGKTEVARQLYERAISISDTRSETRHNLAMIYLNRREFAKAETQYLAALKINADFYYSYMYLGRLYTFTGDFAKAQAALQKAWSLHQDPRIQSFASDLQKLAAEKNGAKQNGATPKTN